MSVLIGYQGTGLAEMFLSCIDIPTTLLITPITSHNFDNNS